MYVHKYNNELGILTQHLFPAWEDHQLWLVLTSTNTSYPNTFWLMLHSLPVDTDTPSHPNNNNKKVKLILYKQGGIFITQTTYIVQ